MVCIITHVPEIHHAGPTLYVQLFVGLIRPAQAAPKESRVLPQLQREAEQDPDKTFRVIVTRQDGKSERR